VLEIQQFQRRRNADQLISTNSISGMTIDEFTASAMNNSAPPSELPETLKALWWTKRGEWERAHKIAQDISSRDGSWVHAHLHRVEGDHSNAGYWYSRAGKPRSSESLDAEWKQIVSAFLGC
jgi:hypothetical protein